MVVVLMYVVLAVLATALFFLRFLTRPLPKPSIPLVPRRADPFTPEAVPAVIDTIVIGSGSGGSCCANLLAQAGHRVLLLEQHSVTGGCTHSFREQGCEWDTGLHYSSKAMANKLQRPGLLLSILLFLFLLSS